MRGINARPIILMLSVFFVFGCVGKNAAKKKLNNEDKLYTVVNENEIIHPAMATEVQKEQFKDLQKDARGKQYSKTLFKW